MLNFQFHNPVKVLFGKGVIAQIGAEIPSGSRILLTYGGGSIKHNGTLDQVLAALKDFENSLRSAAVREYVCDIKSTTSLLPG